MKNDAQVLYKMQELLHNTQEWVSYVKSTGNQCAYSDRQLEKVLSIAEEILQLYKQTNEKEVAQND